MAKTLESFLGLDLEWNVPKPFFVSDNRGRRIISTRRNIFISTMKTFDIACVTRKFNYIFSRLFVTVTIIPWVYFGINYYKDWVYRILTGVKLIGKLPMGGDFSHYWIAANLALSREPTIVYDPVKLQAAMKSFFGVPISLAWLYPPTFFLVLAPLARLPYSTALATWLLITLGFYLWAIKRIAPHSLAIFFAVFFSATFINFGYGQNGFLSTAILGGGLLMTDESPISGGCLLGVLTYKPHLAVLVFVALIAGSHWKALTAFLTTGVGMILASVIIFGYQVWGFFLTNNIPCILKALQMGNLNPLGSPNLPDMPTFFSWFRAVGIGLLLSVVIQGIIMVSLSALVYRVWHQQASLMVRGSVLVLSTLLFSPYLFNYDLCLLALPLAWIAWDGYESGWMLGERFFLYFCWFVPMLSAHTFKNSIIPIAPISLILLLVLVLIHKNRRSGNEKLSVLIHG